MSDLVFFDVGGHVGQTLSEVLRTEYAFDRVECFEPHPQSAAIIEDEYASFIQSNRLRLHNFGLWDKNDSLELFGDNVDAGSSVFADKSVTGQSVSQTVPLRAVSEVVPELSSDNDTVIMKLNCEGAEGPILRNLIETGLIHRFAIIMVDFDLYKVPGKMREPKAIEKAVRDAGFNGLMTAEKVMVGSTHQQRIRNWLAHLVDDYPIATDPAFFNGLPQKQRLKRAIQKRVQRAAKRLVNR